MLFAAMTPEQKTVEIARLDYEAQTAETHERLRIQESLGQSLLKSLTLTNGGALVALFTFIGNSHGSLRLNPTLLWVAFGCFVLGLVSAMAANFAALFMQVRLYTSTQYQAWTNQAAMIGKDEAWDYEAEHNTGHRWEWAARVAVVLSIALFMVGSGLALAGVTIGQ